jgi:CheY-like chemotaxis protein
VSVPLDSDAAVPAPVPGDGAAASVQHLRIVLVEDNADARDAMRALLEVSGHRVEIAADGPSGIELARRVRPDVTLVDIGLPGVDGYEVARRLRADGGAGLRLVALTGYGQPEDRARALDAGFDAHLVKPVEAEDLNRVLAGVTVVHAA